MIRWDAPGPYIVGFATRDGGVIRCWHLEKSPGVANDVGQLNSRAKEVTIPRETCKMPHSFLMVKNRACATLNHEVTMRAHPSRRGEAPQLDRVKRERAKVPGGRRYGERPSNIEPAGFHRRSVFA